jgi:hypothetical protein
MVDLCFVGHEAYTVLGAHCKKIKKKITNIKLSAEGSIYLEWEKESQQISTLEILKNITNITISRKITQ